MNRISLGIAGIAALLVAPLTAAHAADMPLKAPPMVAPPPAYNWSGIYVGINGGLGWGFLDENSIFSSFPNGQVHFGVWGGQVGGQGGIRWQFGQFVIGAEISADWADLNDSVDPTGGGQIIHHLRVNDMFTATGQIGWVWHDVLFYWKGGGAWADVDQELSFPGLGVVATNSQTASGWTFGSGMELPIPAIPGLSAGLEFDFAQLDYKTFQTVGNFGIPFIIFGTSKFDVESLTLRVNYKFNAWAPGPVVTKY